MKKLFFCSMLLSATVYIQSMELLSEYLESQYRLEELQEEQNQRFKNITNYYHENYWNQDEHAIANESITLLLKASHSAMLLTLYLNDPDVIRELCLESFKQLQQCNTNLVTVFKHIGILNKICKMKRSSTNDFDKNYFKSLIQETLNS